MTALIIMGLAVLITIFFPRLWAIFGLLIMGAVVLGGIFAILAFVWLILDTLFG